MNFLSSPRRSRSLQQDDADEDAAASVASQDASSCTCSNNLADNNNNDAAKELQRPQTVQLLTMGGEGAYLDFIAHRFRSRAALYHNRSGHSVNTIGVGDDLSVLTQEILADVDAQVYDGYVFLPFLAGSLLERGGLADLTEWVRQSDTVDWTDIFPFNRDVQSVFDNSVRLLPCDGDVHSLYYRKDLFEAYNIQVPRTWDEYTEAAKFFHGLRVPSANASSNETVVLTGSCVGRKPSCLDFGFFNVLVHSTQTQTNGTTQGSLLDSSNFQPLLGEGLAETLRHLENQVRFGAPDELTYDQCSGLNIERMNDMANCAMTYHWGDVFARHQLETSLLKHGDKLGVAPTPGSTKVLMNGKLVDCTEELCPHGVTYPDIGRVNYAPYAAAGGWSVGVSAGTTPARQKAMADFFGLVCGREISQQDVIPNATDPSQITGTDPYRRSHFDIAKWVVNGYPEEATRLYRDTIETSLSSPNTVIDIRFPDAERFLTAMNDRIFVHLNESLSVQKTHEDRMQVANAIEAEWASLTEEYNSRPTTVRPLKTIYQQSLNVYVPPPPPTTSNDGLSSGAIAAIAIGAALLAAFVTGLLFHWTLRRERKKSDSSWEIKKEDVKLSSDVLGEGSFGDIVKGTFRGTTVAVKPSQHRLQATFATRKGTRQPKASAAVQSATGGSKDLHHVSSSITTSDREETERSGGSASGMSFGAQELKLEQFKEDIKALMKLRNPYIVPVFGAMIEQRTVFVVYEFMEHGSLSSVLSDPTGVAGTEGSPFELQWALQIAKGLQFLHSIEPPLGPLLHGDLKASNILCDGSYNVKLSNFELEERVVGGRRDQGSLLWMAPEVLTGEKPTKEADIYSFAMVLFEIVARARPFHVRRFSKSNLTSYTVSTISNADDAIVPAAGADPNAEYFGQIDGEKLTVPEIISRVSDPLIEPAARPVIPAKAPVLLRDLCLESWSKNPKRRPTVDEIIERLSSASDSRSNLTKNLATRTRLFDSILPLHVQEALARNEPVPPQNYDNVTVIFSDIVSFTATSAKLTAAEVGDLIMRLFNKYDALAEKYGVKKLDVIGDAFLGVTNLPEEMSDHAPRAAGFALEAIYAAQQTQICPSKPDLGTVNIRFGLATGPVVASVIGSSKHPKFTLFGTTVNTASRMESNSLPGRVQCTKETAILIQQQQPAIQVEARGKMEIKGRGALDTFFLNYDPTASGKEKGDYGVLQPSAAGDVDGNQSKKPVVRISVGNFMMSREDASDLNRLAVSRSFDEEQGLSGEMDFPSEEVLKSGTFSVEEGN